MMIGNPHTFRESRSIHDPHDISLMRNALAEAGKITGEYLEQPSPRDAKRTLNRLIAVLDTHEVTAALERIDKPDDLPEFPGG